MLHASGLTQVVGTPAYMAPEQAGGQGVDTRADIHALAAVAYQLLTGKPVRDGSFAALVRSDPAARPLELADVPEELDAVVLRGLQPDPDDRYAEVGDFAAALRRRPCAGGAHTATTPGGACAAAAGPVSRPRRRGRDSGSPCSSCWCWR